MGIRITSIRAYHEVKDSGWIGKKQREIYSFLFNHGPLTSAETFDQLNNGRPIKGLTQSRARFTELRDMELLFEKGKRQCSVTNRLAILWDVTDRFPSKPPKKVTKDQKIKNLQAVIKMVWNHADCTKQMREDIKLKLKTPTSSES